jgi:hypothetical protein
MGHAAGPTASSTASTNKRISSTSSTLTIVRTSTIGRYAAAVCRARIWRAVLTGWSTPGARAYPARLLRGEAQVGGAQLSQLAAGPQPRQRQRRVSPAGHHHPQARRQILQQQRHRLVHRPGIDQVIVIQDQQHLIRARIGRQLIDQGRHQPVKRTRGQRAHPPGQPGPGSLPAARGQRRSMTRCGAWSRRCTRTRPTSSTPGGTCSPTMTPTPTWPGAWTSGPRPSGTSCG